MTSLCSLQVAVAFRDTCKATLPTPDSTAGLPIDVEVSVTTDGVLWVVGEQIFVSRHHARIQRNGSFQNEFYVNLDRSHLRLCFETKEAADRFQTSVITAAYCTRIALAAASRTLMSIGLATLLRPVASAVRLWWIRM